MTLNDWCRIAHETHSRPAEGSPAVSVMIERDKFPTLYAQLWRLSDYRVDHAVGNIVWLTPAKMGCT